MRYDDVQGADWRTLRMDSQALSLTLVRTKTTGAGKRTLQLPVHVRRQASLTGKDWLAEGLALWQHPDFSLERDFFWPLPEPGYDRPSARMATYPEAAAFGRAVLRQLQVPRWTKADGWTDCEGALVPPSSAILWTEPRLSLKHISSRRRSYPVTYACTLVLTTKT